jgi:colanic acid biosynthesis glycosyl transferase WcaI
VIPNFVDTRAIAPRPKDNPFSREFDLSACFCVMYAGNMGPAQGLHTILDAAQLTRDDGRIIYVFVGDGTSRDSLERSARSRQLANVVFIPQQPYDRVADIYGASDLCVVPLVAELVAEAIPSKVYRIMAAERPVLAIADRDSDLAEVVRDSGAGIVVEPGNASGLAEAIRAASRSFNHSLGKLGRKYVLAHVDRGKITKEYSDLLNQAVLMRPDAAH